MNFPKEKRMKMNLTSTSKFVSLILRHKPETIGIQLDEHGWANVDELIAGISKTRKFNREILDTYSQKVWWNCKRSSEHKYPLSPADKVFYQKRHRESCPYCKGRRRKKKFF